MARPMKEHRAISVKIKKSLSDRLTIMTENTKLSKTAVIENALELYLSHYEATGQVEASVLALNTQGK